MMLSAAKREFKKRCHLWWASEFEKEINCAFPNLRLFKSGFGWKMYHFMTRLDVEEQLALARGLLRRWQVENLADLHKQLSDCEKTLLEAFDRFALEPTSFEVEMRLRNEAGENIKLASKRKLRKVAVSQFTDAFGSQCFEMNLGQEWDPLFHMRCCGWVISTQLTFGRRTPLINYRHMIASETRITLPYYSQMGSPSLY
jgi:hypothetical protein